MTSDLADILCCKCMVDNCGMVPDADFRLMIIHTPNFYRVVVTTKLMETDLEFDKLRGVTRHWRQGVELNPTSELN